MPQQAQVDVGLPTPLPSGSLNSRFAKRAISPPLPPVQKGEQMNPLLQLGLGQLASSLYERSPAKPWVNKNVIDPVLNFIVPPAEASIDPTGGKPTAAFAGVKPSEAIQPPQAVSPNLPPVQVATDVTPKDEVSAEARIKDYTDAANFLEQGGEVPEGYDRDALIKDYRDAASYLESGILSLDDLPRVTAAEEAEGVEPFVGANRELFQAAAAKVPEETATKMAQQANQGDLEGVLNTALEVKNEELNRSNLSDEEKKKAKREYEVFGGDPASWLLDFGLAMMACNKPSFMECFGTAGLTAQQSAKDRTKLEGDKALRDLQKMKAMKDLGKGDYDIKTMSYLHPETNERLVGQVRIDKTTGDLEVIRKGKVAYAVDPEHAWTVNTSSESRLNEKSIDQMRKEIQAKEAATDKFLGRAQSQLAFVQSDTKMPQSEFVRSGFISLESLRESVNSIADALGVEVDESFSNRLKNDPEYYDRLMGDGSGLSPEMQSYVDRVGGWENFKAINLSMAIDLAASKGTTGRALSDRDMVNFLTMVGAEAKTREGYMTILNNLINNTMDDFLVDKRMYDQMRMTPEEFKKQDYTDFFKSKYSDPFYQGKWGGHLYNRFATPAAPVQAAPTLPPGANPYSQFDPAPTR